MKILLSNKSIILFLFLSLVGCNVSGAQEAELTWHPEITVTGSPTYTATPTIVWFPATATSTRIPTQPPLPTPQSKPVLGNVVFEDDFSDTGQWPTSRPEDGSIAYGKNELTLAISKPKGNLSAFLDVDLPQQHFMEINTDTSLCRGPDSFGIFIRARNEQEYYRLSINCTGQIKFDLVRRGVVTALTDWNPSGQVLPGPMLSLRLGVWSGENALAIYINDVHQFTISHPGLENGDIGVFARSAGENALTVNYSDLVVYRINEDPAIPLPTPTTTPRPTKTPLKR